MADAKVQKMPTKASVAREYMKSIGALNKNPPEGWINKVEDHLKENGFPQTASSSRIQLYTIRAGAMKKNGKKPAKTSSKKIEQAVPKVSIKDLSAAKKFASGNGGVLKCIEAFKALSTLMSIK